MKRITYLATIVAAGLALLSSGVTRAQAQAFNGGAFQVTITVDGDSRIRTPLPPPADQNTIEFDVTFPNGVEVQGHAFQCITGIKNCVTGDNPVQSRVGFYKPLGSNAKEPALSLTYVNKDDKNATIMGATVTVQSQTYPAATTKAGRGILTLDGKFLHTSTFDNPTITSTAKITLDGFVLNPPNAVPVGELPRPLVDTVPPTAGKSSVKFSYNPLGLPIPIGVTQSMEQVTFNLGAQDQIVLPGSTQLIDYTPEQIITVDTNTDPDLNPGPGCGVPCSLRRAVVAANTPPHANSTAILFNIPGAGVPIIQIDNTSSFNNGSISVGRALIIDGSSQPAGRVAINGINAARPDAAGNPIVGLDLSGSSSMAFGLDIYNFPSHGILMRPTGDPVNGSNDVESNIIGADPTGMIAHPNGGDGINIVSTEPSNTIVSNLIEFNIGHGITVDGSEAIGNYLHENIETGNGGGILLTNGGNKLQPAPGITSANSDGSTVTVTGTVSTPAISIDVFATTSCGASPQGQNFLGSTPTTTDALGKVTFSGSFPEVLTSGESATATATDADGNTSMLSACVPITQTVTTLPPVADAGSNQTVPVGSLVTLNGTGSSDPNNPPLPLTYQWTETSGPAVVLSGDTTATSTFTATQIGTYTFNLVVSNGIASSTPSSVTITVVPTTLISQIANLILDVRALHLSRSLENRLISELNEASASLVAGDERNAIRELREFILLVRLAEGRGITRVQGARLIATARQIIADI